MTFADIPDTSRSIVSTTYVDARPGKEQLVRAAAVVVLIGHHAGTSRLMFDKHHPCGFRTQPGPGSWCVYQQPRPSELGQGIPTPQDLSILAILNLSKADTPQTRRM
jgi:hypothetical protein